VTVQPAAPTVITSNNGQLRLEIPANAFLDGGAVITQALRIVMQPAALPTATPTPSTTPGTGPTASPTPVPYFAFTVDAVLVTSTGETAITTLAQPLTITVAYDPLDVQRRGLIPSTLRIWVADDQTGVLTPLPTTVDTANHTLTAVLPHLSTFVVRGNAIVYRSYLPLWRKNPAFSWQGVGISW
jgi:hypothetical protein